MENIKEIAKIVAEMKNSDEIYDFLMEIMTNSEIQILSKRWKILTELYQGKTQRDIANDLNVSLCKITRGSKILKNKNSIISKYLAKSL